MIFPDDLPSILYYRCGTTNRVTLPCKAVVYVSTSGVTNANQICPQIPFGATGWRVGATDPWQPLSALPPHWLPFLNRPRPSEMDPRRP